MGNPAVSIPSGGAFGYSATSDLALDQSTHDASVVAEIPSGTYEAVGADRLFIPARFFFYTSVGTAAIGTTASRFPSYNMPDAAQSQINCIVDDTRLSLLGWTAFSLDVIHANPNASGGDVDLDITTNSLAAGGDLTTGDAVIFNSVVTAGAQNIHTVTRVANSVAVVTNGIREIRILRDGATAPDTLAGNWNVLGLRLGKV